MASGLINLGWALAGLASMAGPSPECPSPSKTVFCLSQGATNEIPAALRWAEDVTVGAELRAMVQAEFQAFETRGWPNLGRRTSAIWLRLPVVNDLNAPTTRVVAVGWPRLRQVEAFVVPEDDLSRARRLGESGWEMAWADRAVGVSAHAFDVPLPPGLTTVYFRVVSPNELILPVVVLQWPDLLKEVRKETFMLAAYVGVVLVLAIYNVWIFIRMRQRPNLLYAISMFFFLAFTMVNAGWVGALGTGIRLEAHAIWLGGLWLLARMAFTREFLQLATVAPHLDRVLRVLQWLVLPLIGFGLLVLPTTTRESALSMIELPLVFATFMAGIFALRAEVRMAKWFLPATGLLLLGLILAQVIFAGLGVHPIYAGVSVLAGTLAELVVLTAALAEQTREVVAQREQVLRRATSHRLESLERLVAGVTHEMNSPLGALRSSVASIARAGGKLKASLPDPAPKEMTRSLAALTPLTETSLQATQRLEEVVGSLKAFARLDAAQEEPTDLAKGVRSGLVLLAPRLGAIDVHDALPDMPLIRCRVAEVNQAFLALLTNAVDAMPDGGRLDIRGEVTTDAVAIEIRDTGCGIPAEVLPRLFEPHLSRRGRRVKMGLGLSMVKGIVDAHEGGIEVDSQAGVGTRVRLWLPSAQPSRP